MEKIILDEKQLIEAKNKLKADFINYLRANSESAIGKDLDWFQKCFNHIIVRVAEIDNNTFIEESELKKIPKFKKYIQQIGLKIGDMMNKELYFCVSARHYHSILHFVKRYQKLAEIELDLDSKPNKEEKIGEIVEEYYFEDREYSDIYEYKAESIREFAIIVHRQEKFFEIKAFTFGVGDLLPKKNKKYIGGAWGSAMEISNIIFGFFEKIARTYY